MKITTKQLTVAGVFAALVFVATAFLGFPIPTGFGYMHLGDTLVYLSGAILGPFGAIPAGIGSMLADFYLSYAIYAPATLVIKALDALVVGLVFFKLLGDQDTLKTKMIKFALATLCGGALMVTGYFLYETPLYTFDVAKLNIIPNAIQALGGSAMAIVLFPAFDRIFKK